MAEVAERVAELEKALPEGLEAVRKEAQRTAGEQAGALAELERRVAALETAGTGPATPGVGGGVRSAGASWQEIRHRQEVLWFSGHGGPTTTW